MQKHGKVRYLPFYWMLLGMLLLAATLGCGDLPIAVVSPATAAAIPAQTLDAPDDFILDIIASVRQDRIVNDLKQLTGETPLCIDSACFTIQNRLTGSEGLRHAKDYVFKELSSLGYSVVRQDWSLEGYSDQNIIARKTGTLYPNEAIYLVAHLDGVKTTADERFPAADDDGSGVVDLLELARVLSSYTFNRTLVLLFSTGEEQGVLGVRSHVSALSASELSAIQYVVSIDMVGYDANRDSAMQLWSGDHVPSLTFAQQLSELIQEYPLDLSPQVITGCT
jgi:hypothetical protein